jgi:indolepyruvate ferredoxin oxidoreductase alpha subunit
VVNEILDLTSSQEVQVEWTSNEKVAIEMAFGASLAGARSLLCVKGVGLNVALDPLMAFTLTGCNAGLVLLVGDDPGAWGSQNEQDSRSLALAAQVPVLEPTTVLDARRAMHEAFRLSEDVGMPVMVRITRGLVLAWEQLAQEEVSLQDAPVYERDFMRWVVLPINVVPYHRRLHERLRAVQERLEGSSLNGEQGTGPLGVIAAGFSYQKLMDLLGGAVPSGMRVLRLGTFFPLPVERVTAFLRQVDSVLVLEESAPLIERDARAVAQAAELMLPIYGRDSGHLAREGELFEPHIASALNRLSPALSLSVDGTTTRPMPSRSPLCDGCPYIPTFDALVQAIKEHGGRDRFIVTGDPGCMVRAQLPPYELLDVKNSLGSSIGTAAGLALGQHFSRAGERRRVVALCGDSSFLHTGVNGLMDAVRAGAPTLVMILDNGTTALSGGQPHPANAIDARGMPRPAVDLEALARGAGATMVQVVELDREGAVTRIRAAIEGALSTDQVAVIVARGRCLHWTGA